MVPFSRIHSLCDVSSEKQNILDIVGCWLCQCVASYRCYLRSLSLATLRSVAPAIFQFFQNWFPRVRTFLKPDSISSIPAFISHKWHEDCQSIANTTTISLQISLNSHVPSTSSLHGPAGKSLTKRAETYTASDATGFSMHDGLATGRILPQPFQGYA
jgi:hypothetical protein